jgi:hypothetical protein
MKVSDQLQCPAFSPSIYWIESYVDATFGLDTMEKREISFPSLESNIDSSAIQPLD